MIKQQQGFNLMELLIVMGIVSLIAGIAIPTYEESMAKARRTDGQGALLSFANALERFYTINNTYVGAGTEDDGETGPPAAGIFPTEAPVEGRDKFYDLSIDSSSTTGYVLRATPKNAMEDDGYMTLSSTGAREWDEDDSDSIDGGEDDWQRN